MPTNGYVLSRGETKDDVLQTYFDLIVEQAPVPVHVVDANFKITKVNRRWLDKLGYEKSEVLGRPPTDFMSSESRERAARDVIPLFWRVGADRSVGMNFATRGGRVVPMLLDGEVCATDNQHCSAFAVLRDPDDPEQSEGASATIDALHGIAVTQREAMSSLVAAESSTDANEAHSAGPLVEKQRAVKWPSRVPDNLTTRERAVLEALTSGARNREIAGELGTSVRTVKFHVENIFQKLHVHTRTQAASVAIELGLVPRE